MGNLCAFHPINLFLMLPNNLLCSYVAEMMKNRILRFYEKPEGVYHGSVFYQFSGGVGPTSICTDGSGNIFVGHYEIKGLCDTLV